MELMIDTWNFFKKGLDFSDKACGQICDTIGDEFQIEVEVSDYDVENDSFDHAFGTERYPDYAVASDLEIVSCEVVLLSGLNKKLVDYLLDDEYYLESINMEADKLLEDRRGF